MFVKVACLACALLGLTPGEEPDGPWVELEVPRPGEVVRLPVGLVEIRGQAGFGARGSCDVVIALDVSESTLHPTGFDVDGDGRVGRLRKSLQRPPYGFFQHWTSDFDDTVVVSELAFVRHLIQQLDPSRTRVGLLTFSGDAEQQTGLGSHAEALAALDRIESSLRYDPTGSNLGAAVDAAVLTLEEASPALGPPRRRAVVLVSDGEPTAPGDVHRARAAARRAANRARAKAVAIHSVAVGEDASETPGFLGHLSSLGRGRWVPAARRGEIFEVLPRVGDSEIESVEVRNRTTGEPARALRLFDDGSFDGFVELTPGANELEVRVNGRIAWLTTRRVRFERPAEVTPPLVREVERLREALRERTIETELAARAGQRRFRRSLELHAD